MDHVTVCDVDFVEGGTPRIVHPQVVEVVRKIDIDGILEFVVHDPAFARARAAIDAGVLR